MHIQGVSKKTSHSWIGKYGLIFVLFHVPGAIILLIYDCPKVLTNCAPFSCANNTCVLNALYQAVIVSNPKLSSQQPNNNNCLCLIQRQGTMTQSLRTAWQGGVGGGRGDSVNKTYLPRQVVFISCFVNSRVTRAVLHIFISGLVHS